MSAPARFPSQPNRGSTVLSGGLNVDRRTILLHLEMKPVSTEDLNPNVGDDVARQ
jgi:hypothetical protein